MRQSEPVHSVRTVTRLCLPARLTMTAFTDMVAVPALPAHMGMAGRMPIFMQ